MEAVKFWLTNFIVLKFVVFVDWGDAVGRNVCERNIVRSFRFILRVCVGESIENAPLV
jgi:hypothetical protein